MSRSTLRLLAVILSALIVIVAANGLDHLPSSVRQQIAGESSAVAAAQTRLQAEHDRIAAQVQSDPGLFRALPFGQQWPERFSKAQGELQSAAGDLDGLARLEKRDKRSDRQQAEGLLAHAASMRAQALSDADAVGKEAGRWLDARNHLPEQVRQMEQDYQAIHAFDLSPVIAAVQRAATDWPGKRADLEARLGAERDMVAQAESLWQSTAQARRKAAAGDSAGLDVGTLLTSEDSLHTTTAALPQKNGELKSLSGQLYDSWDKLLVDMQQRGEGNAREYDQQIRTVRTHLADSNAKTGETTSSEQWVIVSRAGYDAMRNDLGMTIEHKPAGKYDSESDHVAQPAGMAYVAPPGQQSNQYGYWEHRDGRDFWVFYGQYALLRDLLFNRQYRPFDRYEWEDYRNYQSRGQTYYGRDPGTNAPKYGSQGSSTSERYSGSKYAQGGGFRNSPYASKAGGYRDSPYASPSVRDPNADHTPRSFGGNRPSSEPHAAPAPRAVRPAPVRPPVRSPGRTFGRRR